MQGAFGFGRAAADDRASQAFTNARVQSFGRGAAWAVAIGRASVKAQTAAGFMRSHFLIGGQDHSLTAHALNTASWTAMALARASGSFPT